MKIMVVKDIEREDIEFICKVKLMCAKIPINMYCGFDFYVMVSVFFVF